MRLKDKLGDRSNASSEVEYYDAYGEMVGPEGRGVATIIQMVNHTRLDRAVGSAGVTRAAAAHGVAVVIPDTSPRGVEIEGQDDAYDFGSGAGFYVDATEPKWAGHYKMYSYITKELPELVAAQCAGKVTAQGLVDEEAMMGQADRDNHEYCPPYVEVLRANEPPEVVWSGVSGQIARLDAAAFQRDKKMRTQMTEQHGNAHA